jgi:hypothetical protein
MYDLWTGFWDALMGRVGGPMTFRLVLQPLVAATIGIRAGLRDARTGRPPYFWAAVTDATRRREHLRDGWRDIVKVFVFAAVLDGVYQYFVLHWFHPLQAATVAATLALIPYLLTRGPVCRLARRLRSRRPAGLQ